MKIPLVFVASVFTLGHAQSDFYEGYKVLKTAPLSEEQAKILSKFEGNLDFWRYANPGMPAQVS